MAVWDLLTQFDSSPQCPMRSCEVPMTQSPAAATRKHHITLPANVPCERECVQDECTLVVWGDEVAQTC